MKFPKRPPRMSLCGGRFVMCAVEEGLLSFPRVLSSPTFPPPLCCLPLPLSEVQSPSAGGSGVSVHLHRCGGLMAKPGSSQVSGFASVAIQERERKYRTAGRAHGAPSISRGHRDRTKGWQRGRCTRPPLLVCGVAPLLKAGVAGCSSMITAVSVATPFTG